VRNYIRKLAAAAAAATMLFTLAACDGVDTVTKTELDQLQQVAKTCPPKGVDYFAEVGVDGSTSSRSKDIRAERLAIINKLLTKTATCSGSIRVTAFAGSSVDTVVLYENDLKPEGATLIARLRKVPDIVADAMPLVEQAYEERLPHLANKGSDPIAQLGTAAAHIAQRTADHLVQADVVELTDGFETGIRFDRLSEADAAKLADRFAAVTLPPETKVTIAGLGRVASKDKPDTATVNALKAFHGAYCTTTGAGSCQTVTDYTI
jgi:hypothetical protein